MGFDTTLFLEDGAPSQAVAEKITCGICLQFFQDPVQCNQGHAICRGCLDGVTSLKCPTCRTPMQKSTAVPSIALRERVDEHRMRCENHAFGCGWTGIPSDLKGHLTGCKFHATKCTVPGCEARFLPSQLFQHNADFAQEHVGLMERAATDHAAHVARLETQCESLKKRKMEHEAACRNHVRKTHMMFERSQRKQTQFRHDGIPDNESFIVVANTAIFQQIGPPEETDEPGMVMRRCLWRSVGTPPFPFEFAFSIQSPAGNVHTTQTMNVTKQGLIHECTFCVPKDAIFPHDGGRLVKFLKRSAAPAQQ